MMMPCVVCTDFEERIKKEDDYIKHAELWHQYDAHTFSIHATEPKDEVEDEESNG